MDKQQIAHDLAILKLSGSADLSTQELVALYEKYYEEILEYLRDRNDFVVQIG